MNNLAARVFFVLRDVFFDDEANPVKFTLREKRNTQDDPFDEYIANALDVKLKNDGAHCQRSSGPLISPDMAVFCDGYEVLCEHTSYNPDTIIGIEVKKLERSNNGSVARATGLDYNSTPPCGRICIYSSDDKKLEIKGFYLFACLEEDTEGYYYVSAMSLCDGSILNDDFELYKRITGAREKGINLGTYGDGANRNRPMLIFSNPLGSELLDNKISLISEQELEQGTSDLMLAWRFIRKDTSGNDHIFYTYVDKRDMPNDHIPSDIVEPFPTPKKRVNQTQGRGKFRLNQYYEEINAL